MNKIIEAGDTLSAGLKIVLAVGAVYGVYQLYGFTQDVKESVDEIKQGIDNAEQATGEFFTETVNPGSEENFINQSIVGETLKPVFIGIFDLFGVGK